MHYWLMKSEPDEFGIDDLVGARGQTTSWFGVRNYQARNYMREMQLRDRAFFYHSSCPEPGIAGIVEITKLAHPDVSQFDATGNYYDPKATREHPRWFNVDVKLVERTRFVPLAQLRVQPALAGMVILQRGNRLSITPVTAQEWKLIMRLMARRAGAA
ncbi:MAG: EVE domain-containing protein [Burkholderiales bacterium]|nr:EVE domain-containing protein [Burkholderiales bacterium]